MSQYASRTYIGGKLFSSGTVTSASLTEPRMSTENVLIALSKRTRNYCSADKDRSVVLRGKFKTSAELDRIINPSAGDALMG